jgi:tryptophanyl-tRNA synthetase
MKKNLLSGYRATGKLHLGHLVGALSSCLKLQEQYNEYIMIADIQVSLYSQKLPPYLNLPFIFLI